MVGFNVAYKEINSRDKQHRGFHLVGWYEEVVITTTTTEDKRKHYCVQPRIIFIFLDFSRIFFFFFYETQKVKKENWPQQVQMLNLWHLECD